MTIRLEVCVDDLAGLQAAIDGGADRIELCSRLDLDGLTPDAKLLSEVAACPLPVRAMIRPMPGPFTATHATMNRMRAEIEDCAAAGCEGVVFGLLDEAGKLASAQLRDLCNAAADLGKTLHRAVDQLPDPPEAVTIAEDLGFDTILSSGGAATVDIGAPVLARMVAAARHVTIMPGAGVNAENISEIATQTGAIWLHGSFRGEDGKTSAAHIKRAVRALGC